MNTMTEQAARSDVIEHANEAMPLAAVQPMPVIAPPRDTSPGALLALAIDRGASLEQLDRLLQLQQRIEADAARKSFNESFAAFKASAVTILRTKEIKDGPLKGKKHADLGEIVKTISPALALHGLSLSWKITKDDPNWLEVTCTIRHSAGHSESVSMGGAPDTGPGRNAIQARGSAKSYLERYTATAILGLAAADEDDDGQGGSTRETEDATLAAFRDAAEKGTQALRTYYDQHVPTEEFWKNHGPKLRKDAKTVDEGGAR